jgi:hypothetical protein
MRTFQFEHLGALVALNGFLDELGDRILAHLDTF